MFSVTKVLFGVLLICGAYSMMTGQAVDYEVDERVMELTAKVKSEVEARTNEEYSVFIPVQAMSQVVAGLNFFVKVDVGNNQAVFLRIYDRFGDVSLTKVLTGKSLDDPLVYF